MTFGDISRGSKCFCFADNNKTISRLLTFYSLAIIPIYVLHTFLCVFIFASAFFILKCWLEFIMKLPTLTLVNQLFGYSFWAAASSCSSFYFPLGIRSISEAIWDGHTWKRSDFLPLSMFKTITSIAKLLWILVFCAIFFFSSSLYLGHIQPNQLSSKCGSFSLWKPLWFSQFTFII